ncbi:3-isopropylmalate dehydratase small subunit [Desulforhopalus singaporensis]|uniref:3-isopropylmalate dehydratase n=1 Tax=Desulforhopalus singaporensis TaxID=91360 RepID=A0A1H0QWE7_9BACT|nr:3-isopropylmalate dehydratase [Desulforhopalus singaporensis]SDP21199.1 3-isopropylmalate/(R)-2-methylmalate dehydratase small subunit [Desulforhopalus singaporensis]
MKSFNGKVLFLDRSDINTDEIIPARYLTEITKEALKSYLLDDLSLEGFNPREDVPKHTVIVTRANFGCGSSREHAPWALEVNDFNIVIAENFARIFKQNMFNCGMMAVQLEPAVIDQLFAKFAGKQTSLTTDLEKNVFHFSADGEQESVPFTISGFDRALVEAGGWVGYADSNY